MMMATELGRNEEKADVNVADLTVLSSDWRNCELCGSHQFVLAADPADGRQFEMDELTTPFKDWKILARKAEELEQARRPPVGRACGLKSGWNGDKQD
jgi:hypothetical protein